MKNHQTWTFAVQVFFSTVVLGLCTFKLIANKPQDNQALYWGGLTGILGYWLPAPTNSKNEEQQYLLRSQYNYNKTTENGLVEQSEKSHQAVAITKTDE
ncbi:MAG: hypothetical protein KME46_26515 [Brasilonema angustatum HA4187-MV1]|nr:hypothetical protein [Brasilonema angustatum HA4187-MV1]